MTVIPDPNLLDRTPAGDLWRNTLSQIPSVFGRLVYLSGLRNPNSGSYEHHGLALRFGVPESTRVLRRSHMRTFEEWLAFNIEEQKADLDLYLSALAEDKATVVDTWLKLDQYRGYIPAAARSPEKRLYCSDLQAILAMLRNEYAGAGLHRDALPRP